MFKNGMFKEKKFEEVLMTHTKLSVSTANNTAITRNIGFSLDGKKMSKV